MNDQLAVLLDPYFRTLDQIFSPRDLNRLRSFTKVIWGKDQQMPSEQINSLREDVDVIITGRWRYGDVSSFPRLRAIIEVGGKHPGPDIIDYRHCFANGIYVLSCAPAFAPMVAEMALGLAISACRNLCEMDRAFRDGTELYQSEGNKGAFTLYDARIGLIGYGNLARSLVPLLKPFTTDISAYDPWLPDSYLRRINIEPSELEDLLTTSDITFVLAIPTSENKGMINADMLEKVKPGSVFVLMSRAHVVDFDALVELLKAGRFRLATDVYPKEPVPSGHPVRNLSHAVLTPHIAGTVREDIRTIGRWVVDDVEAISRGIPPQSLQQARLETVKRL